MAQLTDPSIKTVNTLADGDLIHNVDVSDTTANAAGTSAKISFGDFKSSVGVSSNVINVTSEADLPEAVGNVITFGAAQNGLTYVADDAFVYDKDFVIEGEINIKFTCTNLDKAWIYVGTGTMFTSSDFGTIEFDNFVGVSSDPSATMFNLSGAGSVFVSRSLFLGSGGTGGVIANDLTTMLFCTLSDFGAGFDISCAGGFAFTEGSIDTWQNQPSTTMLKFSPPMTFISIYDNGFVTSGANETILDIDETLLTAGTRININTTDFDITLGGIIFAPNSLDQTSLNSKYSGNVGVADSTVTAKIRFVGNAAATTIAGISVNTPINTTSSYEVLILERFVSQDLITFDFTTNALNTAFNHGLSANDRLQLFTYTGTLPAELDAATRYFVINPTATTFQLSLTSGGGAVNFTDDGTGVLYYRHGINSFSNSGELIYLGIEDISLSGSGWIALQNDTNNFDNMRGVVMKIDVAGVVAEDQTGSPENANNTRPSSSILSDILSLSSGEGVVLNIRNDTAVRDIIAVESLLTINA